MEKEYRLWILRLLSQFKYWIQARARIGKLSYQVDREFFEQTTHFKPEEFASPDQLNSWRYMNPELLCRVFDARMLCDFPWIITSGFRTGYWNARVGGVLNSSHLNGTACDIAFKNSRQCYEIIDALMVFGITRFGISHRKKFIHCDVDPTKQEACMWGY